jgi:hypothetical protein
MISRLRSIRLTWPQLAIVAASSVLATTVIIHATTGVRHLSSAELVALRQRVAVHTIASPPVAPRLAASTRQTVPAPVTASALSAPATAPVAANAPAAASPTSPGETAVATGSDAANGTAPPPGGTTQNTAHPVKHVFLIALTTTGYGATFGPGSPAHYLNHTLRPHGTLLSGYRTLGGSELPDYLAMVSGQAPNSDTRDDCATYSEFPTSAKPTASGQVRGAGCVYPNTVLTIADQLTAAGKQWKAYLADMGSSTCMHPDSNAAAGGQLPGAGVQYVPRHNPFIYFHSLLDLGGCSGDDLDLSHLTADLRAAKRTPNYSFIAPGLCSEPAGTTCPSGRPGGVVAEDAFLRRWVPAIMSSAAYKQHGVLMIVFAKAPSVQSVRPVRTGALVLSSDTKARRTIAGSYNPYSVLRSIEDLFGYVALVHARSAKSFAKTLLPGA